MGHAATWTQIGSSRRLVHADVAGGSIEASLAMAPDGQPEASTTPRLPRGYPEAPSPALAPELVEAAGWRARESCGGGGGGGGSRSAATERQHLRQPSTCRLGRPFERFAGGSWLVGWAAADDARRSHPRLHKPRNRLPWRGTTRARR